MLEDEIADWLSTDKCLFPIKALKQHWKRTKFSYMDDPRPDFGLMLLTHGEINFVFRDGSISARAGDVVFLPKGYYYEADFCVGQGEADTYLINFDTETGNEKWGCPVKLIENTSFSCGERFKKLVEEKFSVTHSELQCRGLFYLLLDAVLRERDDPRDAGRKIFDQAQALMHNEGDMSVGDIARKCCISESGLRRLFHENAGMSPTKYRIGVKLNQAMYLLESTDMSVNEIAERLNFYDSAYFCKVFLANVGVTPKQYSQNKRL